MSADELAALPGLGTRSAPMLVSVGVESCADLDQLGSLEVFRRLRTAHDNVSLNFLWALESLLLGCDWRDLPSSRKAELRAELDA